LGVALANRKNQWSPKPVQLVPLLVRKEKSELCFCQNVKRLLQTVVQFHCLVTPISAEVQVVPLLLKETRLLLVLANRFAPLAAIEVTTFVCQTGCGHVCPLFVRCRPHCCSRQKKFIPDKAIEEMPGHRSSIRVIQI